jgi:thiamine-monophosphate kinase
MKASSLGERGIIELIWSVLGDRPQNNPAEMVLPLPDDASAVKMNDGNYLVLKTDMFVRRTDAPKGMTHHQMGVKAFAMNISDLAAKGARPFAFLFSLGLPKSYRVSSIRSLIKGLSLASAEYATPILGGDVGEAKDLIVAGFLSGAAKSLVRRSGASPGDTLAVTGRFGNTASAFKILFEGKSASSDLTHLLLSSVYNPRARLAVGLAVAGSHAATSSMDSSDGLAYTLNGMAKASGVGFAVDSLPLSNGAMAFAKLHGLDPNGLALFGGEEYEIVYTIKQGGWSFAEKAARDAGGELIRIGEVVNGKGVFLRDHKSENPIPDRGWEHLRAT